MGNVNLFFFLSTPSANGSSIFSLRQTERESKHSVPYCFLIMYNDYKDFNLGKTQNYPKSKEICY